MPRASAPLLVRQGVFVAHISEPAMLLAVLSALAPSPPGGTACPLAALLTVAATVLAAAVGSMSGRKVRGLRDVLYYSRDPLNSYDNIASIN